MIDLLVDSQTAAAVESWDDGYPNPPLANRAPPSTDTATGDCHPPPHKRTRGHNTIATDAAAAARFLSEYCVVVPHAAGAVAAAAVLCVTWVRESAAEYKC